MNIQKIAGISIVLAALFFLGIFLKAVFAPLILSVILALVILPLVNLLERVGFNRFFSGLTVVGLIALFFLGIGLVGVLQMKDLGAGFSNLEDAFFTKLNQIGQYMPETVQLPNMREVNDIEKVLPEDLGFLGSFVGDALQVTGDVLTTLTLIPIFVFFILFYRSRISRFLQWIDSKGSGEFRLATTESKKMVQNYLSGLGLVILINSTLAATGLWAIGISYALLLGVLSALLTVIPYIGTFVGALIPILFAFLTKDSLAYGFGVMALYAVIQFLENNFISPIVLGNSVNVNPFASVLALLVMGQYWGIIGMVIAVPLTGILVILVDHSETLNPLNLLLKNEQD